MKVSGKRMRNDAKEQTPLLAHPSPQEPTIDFERNIPENTSSQESENSTQSSPAFIIMVLLISVFVANAEGSLVLATYGRISSEFNELEYASWLVTSYALAVAAVQPIYGKLSDIFGRAHMILIAYAFFAAGCLVCAIGPSLQVVVLGRVISGIGGAGMGSLVSILITDLVPLREVGAWRSYVNIVATSGRSLGSPMGGYLADTVGWRWSSLRQCPPTIFAMLPVWILVPKFSKGSENEKILRKLSRVDFLGALVLVSAITTFLLPLELGGNAVAWSHPLVLSFFIVSVALAIFFFLVEGSIAKEPILSISLLTSWKVMVPNTVMFCQTAAQLGMMYTVPIFFQVTQGASSTVAGAHLFPAVVGVAVAGLLGGFLTKRTRKYKKMLVLATPCSSTSYILLASRWDGHIGSLEPMYIVPGGFGNGLVQSAAFVALTAGIDTDQMAMACSSFYMSANTGTVVGLATTSAVLQGTLRHGLERRLNNYSDKNMIVHNVLSNMNYIKDLDGPLKIIVVSAYLHAFKLAHFNNLGFSTVAFLASLALREHQL